MDFKTLIAKLYHLGFIKNVLKLVLSYLSGRKQFVQFDEKISSMLCVNFGVPKDSYLLQFYLTYVSDLQYKLSSILRILHFMSIPK